jgi:hypothetical protein
MPKHNYQSTQSKFSVQHCYIFSFVLGCSGGRNISVIVIVIGPVLLSLDGNKLN